MIRGPMKEFIAALKEKRLAPTVIAHHSNGKTALRWYINNNEDCYVEAVDSLYSASFVIFRRTQQDAVITVEDSIDKAVVWIDEQLKVLLLRA